MSKKSAQIRIDQLCKKIRRLENYLDVYGEAGMLMALEEDEIVRKLEALYDEVSELEGILVDAV